MRPDGDGFGPSPGFDSGRGGEQFKSGGPLLGDFRAPTVFDALGPGGAAPILVLPSGGWNSPMMRDVVTTLLLVDLLGWSNSYLPPPSPTSLSAAPSLPAPNGLGGAQLAAVASSASLVAKTNDPDAVESATDAAIDRLTSPNTFPANVAALAGVNTAVSLQSTMGSRVSPLADSTRANQLPSFIIQDDASAAESDGLSNTIDAPGAARLDAEGGLVELSPGGAQLPHSRILKTEDKLDGAVRRQNLTDSEAFWGDVLDSLDELLNDLGDEQPVAKARKPVWAEHGAQDQRYQAIRESHSPAAPVALFDEGGLIACSPAALRKAKHARTMTFRSWIPSMSPWMPAWRCSERLNGVTDPSRMRRRQPPHRAKTIVPLAAI